MLNFAEIERSIMGNENHKHLVTRVNEKALHYISVKKIIFSYLKHSLQEIKEKYPPQPIDLNEKIKENEVEVDLRSKKENEQRIAHEKKEKERIEDNV